MSEGQAITVTAVCTDKIDLKAAGIPFGAQAALHRDIGKGTPVPILIQVTEDFATLVSMVITLETSDNADLSSSTVVYSSDAILAATLVAGYQVPLQFLPHGLTSRYLGVRYTVTGTATAGKIQAGLTMGNQSNTTGA